MFHVELCEIQKDWFHVEHFTKRVPSLIPIFHLCFNKLKIPVSPYYRKNILKDQLVIVNLLT